MTNTPPEKELRFAVLATDIVTFRYENHTLLALLIDVYAPSVFIGKKAFPGGLIRPTETAEDSVHRLLEDKGGISKDHLYIEQLYTFSALDRDPRGRVVSVAYMGLTNSGSLEKTDVHPYWAPVSSISNLAYDHDLILKKAKRRLQSKLKYTTAARFLLPDEFTLTDLEKLYETVLDEVLDKRNFRKKLLKLDILEATGKKTSGLQQRPAELYRFKGKSIEEVNIM